MHARLALLAVSLAPLFVASLATLAHAQAPGEVLVVQPAPPADACGCVPGAARVAGEPRESVMANRWALGLSLGSMSLAPDGRSDDKTAFGVGELSLRFRATPRFELELAAGGGRDQLDDGSQGDLQVNTVALAARFRFNPEGAWNWFATAGLGAASVTFHDATQDQRDAATHPMAMLGVGVERRFHHFALQAEARAIGIAERKQDDAMAVSAASGAIDPITTERASQKLSGGSLSFGASYYF